MMKKKKLMIIFSALMLSAVLMVGCSQSPAEDNLPTDESGINNLEDTIQQRQETENDEIKEEQTSSYANGILKSFDKETGMITIITENNDELTLKITDASKFLVNDEPMIDDQLTKIVGSEVSVEYDAQANTVKTINVKKK